MCACEGLGRIRPKRRQNTGLSNMLLFIVLSIGTYEEITQMGNKPRRRQEICTYRLTLRYSNNIKNLHKTLSHAESPRHIGRRKLGIDEM